MVPQFWQQIHETGKARLFQSHDRTMTMADGNSGFRACLGHGLGDDVAGTNTGGQRDIQPRHRSGALLRRSRQAIFETLARPRISTIAMPRASQSVPVLGSRDGWLRGAGYDKTFISLEDGVRSYVGTYLESNDRYLTLTHGPTTAARRPCPFPTSTRLRLPSAPSPSAGMRWPSSAACWRDGPICALAAAPATGDDDGRTGG